MSEAKDVGPIREVAAPRRLPKAATPGQLLQIAVEQGADLDRLEKLMALQERWEANEARKAYVAAIAAFKAEPPRIVKAKHVDYTSKRTQERTEYWHATLGDIVNAISPRMSANGLSFQWFTTQEADRITVRCVMRHDLGHSEEVQLSGGRDDSGGKNAIQAIGSTVTYLQRYTLLAICGLATEDDDGRGSVASNEHEPARISEEELNTLDAYITENGINREKFLAYIHKARGYAALEDILAIDFEWSMHQLSTAVKSPK